MMASVEVTMGVAEKRDPMAGEGDGGARSREAGVGARRWEERRWWMGDPWHRIDSRGLGGWRRCERRWRMEATAGGGLSLVLPAEGSPDAGKMAPSGDLQWRRASGMVGAVTDSGRRRRSRVATRSCRQRGMRKRWRACRSLGEGFGRAIVSGSEETATSVADQRRWWSYSDGDDGQGCWNSPEMKEVVAGVVA